MTAFPTSFPQPPVAVVNRDGSLTNDGASFLLALFNRTGGAGGVPQTVSPQSAASGATQADATLLSESWARITDVPVGSGVVLSAMQPGEMQLVSNGGVNNLLVYPPAGYSMNALGVDAPFTLPSDTMQVFMCLSAGAIFTLALV
jgi:hypothetical protein